VVGEDVRREGEGGFEEVDVEGAQFAEVGG